MSRYIEFNTPVDDDLYEFSFGNPVYDGRLPTRFRAVRGVRIDGEVTTFNDESLVDSLYRTLVQIRGLFRRPYADCVSFAAAMNGLPLPGPDYNPLERTRIDVPIDSDDATVTDTLNLGVLNSRAGWFEYLHSVVPAHTATTAQYVHKLGDEGPICITSLEDAMSMYGCIVAHPVILDKP